MRPDYTEAHYFLGMTYQEMGDLSKASEQFENYQEENPGTEIPNVDGTSILNEKSDE